MAYGQNAPSCDPLTAHNWQKWKKSRFLSPCHEVYRVEAVGLAIAYYAYKLQYLGICEIWGYFMKI